MLREVYGRWRDADWYVDVAIAAIVAVLGAAGAWVDDPGDPGTHGWVPALLALAAGLVLIARRVLPLTVLICVLTILVVVSVDGHQVGTTPVALLFASHAVGRWAPGPRGLLGLGVIWSVFAVLAVLGDAYFTRPEAVLAPVVYGLPFVVGRYVARRAVHLDDEREAARLVERARIARELHDIVSHALTGISVQASTARHLRVGGPEATETFGRIEQSSRQALGDLRRMLVLLRDDGDGVTHDHPGPDALHDLTAAHAAIHGPVVLDVADDVRDLDPSLGLVVYRLVQESLTNVARHAHGAPATVRVHRDGGTLVVVIEDDGRGVTTPGRRTFGIVGIRERVAVFGGTVEAGLRSGGGFRVCARIPVTP